MRPFYSKDGRLIVPLEHEAKFVGKRNSCKGKVLIILYHFKDKYLTARQIHEYTGVSYEYLETRLSFWYNIRYINRKPLSRAKGQPVWTYQIAERGKHFVDFRMPQDSHNTYVSEINAWIKEHRATSSFT